MKWSTATPEQILADIAALAERQPPVADPTTGQWRRWAVEPDGRVVLVVHAGPHPLTR